MHQECSVLPFLRIYVVIDYSKTVFTLIKDKEIGFTLLAVITKSCVRKILSLKYPHLEMQNHA